MPNKLVDNEFSMVTGYRINMQIAIKIGNK
jgi:hypothetical protein